MLPCLLLLFWELILIGQLFFILKSFRASGHISGKLSEMGYAMPKINTFEILSLYIYFVPNLDKDSTENACLLL